MLQNQKVRKGVALLLGCLVLTIMGLIRLSYTLGARGSLSGITKFPYVLPCPLLEVTGKLHQPSSGGRSTP
jgi:hypothetical protein